MADDSNSREPVREEKPVEDSFTSVQIPSMQKLGRYERLEFLGQGGMGTVYKAFDPTLDRFVALKLIRRDEPQLAARLQMEARAQARIEHEHVCKVYEVGVVDSLPYISMQFINGKSFKELSDKLTIEEKIKLMKETAEAVQAAHRAGLIHRDLKPANVMVERNEEGEWIPFVMDFGLAREVDSPGLTKTGVAVGSPWYMSPEQAQGDFQNLDRRSDVYSLGVTLYELLTGTVPFPGNSPLEILLKVIHEDPIPPRQVNPNIPTELQVIILKCIEKEKEKRYDSAKALAEDLRRYLGGDPILAKPVGPAYRLIKKVRKHKALFATTSSALLVIVVLGLILLHTRWQASRQAELANQFGQKIKEVEGIMRFAYMQPLHDTSFEAEMVRDRMDWIAQKMEAIGRPGYGPGHYALGRGYFVLKEYGKALDHLEKAWNSEYREAQVSYALGLTLGKLYQEKLEESNRIKNKELRKAYEADLEKKYRVPAEQYLRSGRTVETEAPEYAEALLSFYKKDWNQALRHTEDAKKKIPWFYEALVLQADTYVAVAKDYSDRGEYKRAFEYFSKATEKYETASDMARSDPGIYEKECDQWAAVMLAEYETGKSPEGAFEASQTSCEKALVADPRSAAAYDKSAYVAWQWGKFLMVRGQDPEPVLKKAIELAGRAGDLKSEWAQPFNTAGVAYLALGENALQTGRSPVDDLRKAIRNYDQAIRLDPGFGVSYSNRGAAYMYLGQHAIQRGEDPKDLLQKAIDSYREAIRINPNHSAVYTNMGSAYWNLAVHAAQQGSDAEPLYRNAIENYRKGLDLRPGFFLALTNLGIAYRDLGGYLMNRGTDPTELFQKAVENYEKALKINPNHPYVFVGLSNTYVQHAAYLLQKGADPSDLLRKSIEFADKTLSLDPKDTYAYQDRGLAYWHLAEYAASQGKEAQRLFREALQAFQSAIQEKPDLAENYVHAAGVLIETAEVQLEKNQPVENTLKEAQSFLETAHRLNLETPSIVWRQGEIYLLQAQGRMRKHLSPDREFAMARSALEEALSLNPQDAEVRLSMAEFCLRQAEWKFDGRRSADDEIREGSESVAEALRLHPEMAEAIALEGIFHLLRARGEANSASRKEELQLAASNLRRALLLNAGLKRKYQIYLDAGESKLRSEK